MFSRKQLKNLGAEFEDEKPSEPTPMPKHEMECKVEVSIPEQAALAAAVEKLSAAVDNMCKDEEESLLDGGEEPEKQKEWLFEVKRDGDKLIKTIRAKEI